MSRPAVGWGRTRKSPQLPVEAAQVGESPSLWAGFPLWWASAGAPGVFTLWSSSISPSSFLAKQEVRCGLEFANEVVCNFGAYRWLSVYASSILSCFQSKWSGRTPVVGGVLLCFVSCFIFIFYFWNDRLLLAGYAVSLQSSCVRTCGVLILWGFFEIWSIHVETSCCVVASNWSRYCRYTFSLLSGHKTLAFFHSYIGRVWKYYKVIESETRPLKHLRSPCYPLKKKISLHVLEGIYLLMCLCPEAKKASGLEFGCLDSYPTPINCCSPVILGKLLSSAQSCHGKYGNSLSTWSGVNTVITTPTCTIDLN